MRKNAWLMIFSALILVSVFSLVDSFCIDAEPETDPFVKGIITWNKGEGVKETPDFCKGNVLFERSCSGEDSSVAEYNCEDYGMSCIDGKCVLPSCGNSLCEYDENHSNCPEDCEKNCEPLINFGEPKSEYNGLKFADENFTVIVPEGYQTYGKEFFNGIHECEKTLNGFTGYCRPWNRSVYRIMLAPVYSGRTSNGTIQIKSTEERMNEELNPGAKCLTPLVAHESIHAFIVDENVPYWTSEGLATYFADVSSLYNNGDITCRNNSIEICYNNRSRCDEFSYVNLNQDYSTTLGYYQTGACFWEMINVNYGEEKFREILKKMLVEPIERPEFEGIVDPADNLLFVSYYVAPIVGESVWNETSRFMQALPFCGDNSCNFPDENELSCSADCENVSIVGISCSDGDGEDEHISSQVDAVFEIDGEQKEKSFSDECLWVNNTKLLGEWVCLDNLPASLSYNCMSAGEECKFGKCIEVNETTFSENDGEEVPSILNPVFDAGKSDKEISIFRKIINRFQSLFHKK